MKNSGIIKVFGIGLVVVVLLCGSIFGQSTHQVSQGITGNNLAPGSPNGSYAVSGFESINPFSGKPNFSLPLLKVGGRGSAGYSMNLTIQKNWTIQHEVNDPNTYLPSSEQYFIEHKYKPVEQSDSLLTYGIDTSTQMGVMKGTRFGTNRDVRLCGNQPCYDETLSKLSFITPDGTEIEFRDVLTGGKAKLFAIGDGSMTFSRGTSWVSVDGSNAVFISNADIFDYRSKSLVGDGIFLVSGILTLANGTKYTIQDGKATEIKDINGNRVVLGTDSIGREITVTQTLNPAPNILRDKVINFKGTNGTPRTIKTRYSFLESRLSAGFTLSDLWGLFSGVPIPNGQTGITHNPEVVSFVELPDGRNYEFKYNNYGELTEIMLPTGGKIEYVWQTSSGLYGQATEIQPPPGTPPDDELDFRVYRRVEKRRVYENNQLQNETVYGVPVSLANNIHSVTVEIYRKENNVLVLDNKSKHYYSGNPLFNVINPDARRPTEEPNWLEGKELKTEIYNASNVLLRQTDNMWQAGTALSANPTANINARLAEVKTTLADENLVSKTTYTYDEYNNQTDVYEYDYETGDYGTFKRRSHTDFVTDTNYINANLKHLPSQSWVSSDVNGTDKVSFSQTEYDNYSENPLILRSNVIGHDTANHGTNKTIRGNATKVTTYSDAQNQSGAISVKSQYDILGNVVKTIDAKGNINTIDYTDRFGSPNHEAQSNTAPGQLNGLSTFAFPTSGTNALGWNIGYLQRDYFTGALVNAEGPLANDGDINGVISKTIYNDLLDRPTQSVTGIGTPHERQSNVIYDDANRRIEAKSDLFELNDNLSKSESFYDGLGRTIESRKYESDGGYIKTNTEFDGLGRPKRATNPYRPLQNEPIYWTESFYDSVGRVIKVKTLSDNAEVLTSYFGNTVTVTDQSGKKRRGVTNALGQLTRVDEPNDAGQLDVSGTPAQPTSYSYDVLNNLLQVQQIGTTTQQCGGSTSNCTQTRTFVYDSLSRLKQATNPESGTISYVYDNNGNLTNKTDARSVATTYTYDALNRVLTRNYSNEPSGQTATPNVTYTYDDSNIVNAKGKLTRVSSSISETRYTAFDLLGKVLSSQQITDGRTFNSSYVYNLPGAMIEQTYPSGRVVKNTFDNDGEVVQVQSKKVNDTFKNYANSFNYTAAGAVSSMRLGNGLWENTSFNSRLQPTQIGLGSGATSQNLLKLNYDYGSTSNNGNVQSQTITVQRSNQSPLVLNQSYVYDPLNRLMSAEEKDASNATTWKQTYSFDRYGNRRFDQANTSFPTSFTNMNLTNPMIDTANNRFTTGQGYTYDLSGNLLTDAEGRSYTYDAENKQKEAKNSSSQTIGEYWYDGDGKRVKKKGLHNGQLEETIFVYDAGGKLVAEYSTQPSTTPQVQYLTNDNLGTPRINTDELGAIVSRSDYMPYGEEIVSLGNRTSAEKYVSDDVRQGFTGYERDSETDLDFAQARYYAKSFGRFNSVDPIKMTKERLADPQRINLYVYVRNSPMKYIDKIGEDVEIAARSEDKARKDFETFLSGLRTEDREFVSFFVGDGNNGYQKGSFYILVDPNQKSDSKNFQFAQNAANDRTSLTKLQVAVEGDIYSWREVEYDANNNPIIGQVHTATITTQDWQNYVAYTFFELRGIPDPKINWYSTGNFTLILIFGGSGTGPLLITQSMHHELRHAVLGKFGRDSLAGIHPVVDAETTEAEGEAAENSGLVPKPKRICQKCRTNKIADWEEDF